MPYGLSDENLSRIVDTVAANQRVQQAVLFGSRVKGTQRPGSDIDIVLKGNELTFSDLLTISIALDELWLPFQFDLVLYHRIQDPSLLAHIDRVGKIILSEKATTIG